MIFKINILLVAAICLLSCESNTNNKHLASKNITEIKPTDLSNGTIKLSKSSSSCDFCKGNVVFKNDFCSFYENNFFGVLAIEERGEDGTGEDFYVFKPSNDKGNLRTVNLKDSLFSIKSATFGNAYFNGLYQDFLIIDEGTSASSRGLCFVNLNSRKMGSMYSSLGLDSFDGELAKFWFWSKTPIDSVCPELKDSCCFGVIDEFLLNVTTDEVIKTGKQSCSYEE